LEAVKAASFFFSLALALALAGCAVNSKKARTPSEICDPECQKEAARITESQKTPSINRDNSRAVSPVKDPVQVGRVPQGKKTGAYFAKYSVIPKDSLWRIAAKPRVFNDPFQWPTLWKDNADKIEDPNLIYPGQLLKVRRIYREGEREWSRTRAARYKKGDREP
jgi:hypothetical protein